MMVESAEVRQLRWYMAESKVPHRVTSTTGGAHAAGSYHYRSGTNGDGLAVDFAGLVPGEDTPELRAVYEALVPLGPSCAELIYSGPGGGFWKHGGKVAPYAVLGHRNHVHVAVPKGTFVVWPKEAVVADAVKVNHPIIAFEVTPTGKGYWFVTAEGGVFAFGDAEFYGRVEAPLS